MLVHWFPSTQVDSRTRGSSPSPLQAGQDVVHLVPEGMSVSYGLRSPSHVHEEYLTPARLSLISSRALHEHLGGPEAQLSPTEHLVALRSYNLKTLTKKIPSKTYYGNVCNHHIHKYCRRNTGPARKTTVDDIASSRPDVQGGARHWQAFLDATLCKRTGGCTEGNHDGVGK